MNSLTLLLSQNPKFKLVKALFPNSSNPYTYKTLLDVEVDQHAIVRTPKGVKVVLITEVLNPAECDLDFSYELKWLVDTVSFEHYEHCLEVDREVNSALNAIKRKKEQQLVMDELRDTLGQDGLDTVTKLVRL